jgi:tetratricopeptide (TPR) repeat protein
MTRKRSLGRGHRARGNGGVCALLVALCALVAAEASAARKYGRRVRAQDECRVVSSPTTADIEKAKRYYESGVIYYDTKDYARAREEFQKAWDISRDPEFLVNLSAVAAKQKQYPDAIKFLEQYIDECPNAPDTFSARQRVDDLRIAVAIQDGNKPPPPPQRKRTLPPIPALAMMGGGLGAIIIGAGLGAGALSDSARIESTSNQNMVFGPDLQSIASRGKALQGAAITFDVLGGLALAAGAIWTGVWYTRRNDGLTLSLAPVPGGMLVGGTF